MNAALLILFGLAWLAFAYAWYGRIIDRRVVRPDDSIEPPSTRKRDGADFVPTHPVVLFGHHFSSIAGAGPIVGPILAFAMFGWLPALLWILLGVVFMGAVHDYTSLMASVRSGGDSIVNIAERAVSPTARTIFAVFVWLALALVQAVFADLTARTVVEKPEIALPTIGVIFIALLFGWMVYRRGMNLVLGTVIALALLLLLIIEGPAYPIVAGYQTWLLVFIVYAYIASVLPVWVLLQPRDYISVYILLAGMVVGFAGMLVMQPEINAPAFTGFSAPNGTPLFPILFITVACGSVSGFHSLVASGTSAKQLRVERDGKRVAFGGMLTEGALALLVVGMVGSVLAWAPGGAAATGGFVFGDLLSKSANIVFGTALGRVGESLGIPLQSGIAFGVLMLNAFILTTLDTTVRLSRYITQESVGARFGGVFANKYAASAASLVLAWLLCMSNGYKLLWPVFGASNQLIAALALFVAAAYWTGFGRPKSFMFWPGVFMLVVTESALAYQIGWMYLPARDWLLLSVSALLMVLGLIVAVEVVRSFRGRTLTVNGAAPLPD